MRVVRRLLSNVARTKRFGGTNYKLAEWLDDRPHEYLLKQISERRKKREPLDDDIPDNVLPELWRSAEISIKDLKKYRS